MKRRWQLGLAAVIVASVVLGIYVGNTRREPSIDTALIPEAAVTQFFSMRLNDADGKMQPMSQWRGKTLVINFWATWCPPCREEMPAFSRLQTKYAANGVQFLGIALDTPDNVSAFLKQVTATYPLLLAESEGMAMTQQLGNSRLALPYTLVLGADEKPRLVRLGKLDERDLDRLLGEMSHLK
jgi:thiol-disulfide isomerase/thioredoxin